MSRSPRTRWTQRPLAACAAALLVAPAATAQDALFNGELFDTGSSVSSSIDREDGTLLLADIDRDGVLDAITDSEDGPVLLTGTGDGRFVDPLFLSGPNPHMPALFLTDMTGDGEADFVATSNDQIIVWPHDGVDSLLPAFSVPLPQFTRFSTLGDVNADGLADIVSGQTLSETITVYLSNGDGTFSPLAPVSSYEVEGLGLGDLDGDGDVDLVAYTYDFNGSTGFHVESWLGDGSGRFAKVNDQSGYIGGEIAEGRTLQLTDLDEDGNLDVALGAPGFNGAFVLLYGDGTGAFPAHTLIPVDDGIDFLVLADANGDGRLDLVGSRDDDGSAQARDDNVIVALALGGGAFAPQLPYSFGPAPARVAVGDVDGGGTPDLLVSVPQCATLAVLRAEIDGGVTSTFIEHDPGSWSDQVDVRCLDLDGDSHKDIVVLEGFHGLNVLLGDGDEDLTFASEYTTGYEPRSFDLGDLDQDGDADVVAASQAADKVFVRLNDGAGSWTSKPAIELAEQNPSAVVLADMDLDGRLDIVTNSEPPAVLLGDGDGTFGPPLYAPSGDVGRLRVGDIDGDGDLDVLGSRNGAIDVFLGDGTGALAVGLPIPVPAVGFVVDFVLADLDGDTDLDVAGADYFGHALWTLFNNGAGVFIAGSELPAGPDPWRVGAADLSGDGLVDLVVANGGHEAFSVLLGDGAGGFGAPRSYLARGIVNAFDVADFDEDLRPDLVMAHGPLPDRVVVIRNQAGEPVWADLGGGLAGTGAQLALSGEGSLLPATTAELRVTGGAPFGLATLVLGVAQLSAPFKGGVLVPTPDVLVPLPLDGAGAVVLTLPWPALPSGAELFWQAWRSDAGAPKGLAASNGLRSRTP